MKNFLETIKGLTTDTKLKCNEKVLLLYLVQCHNEDLGYAYPPYDSIKTALSTKRNDTVSNTLKGLVEKGYISIEKHGRNNVYHVLKHLYFVSEEVKEDPKPQPVKPVKVAEDPKPVQVPIKETKEEQEEVAPVDSNGNRPMQGQLHIADLGVDIQDANHVQVLTGATDQEVAEMFQLANGDKGLILKAIGYTKNQQGVAHIPAYVKTMIKKFKENPNANSNHNVKYDQQYGKSSALKFNNFEPRHYDYDSLERKLLGWDEVSDDEQLPVFGGSEN